MSDATNDINLAAMWVPIMPETSKFDRSLKDAGRRGSKTLHDAFHEGDPGGKLGTEFGDRFQRSFSDRLKNAPFLDEFNNLVTKFHSQVNAPLAAALKKQLPEAAETFNRALADLTAAKERDNVVTARMELLKTATIKNQSVIYRANQQHAKLQDEIARKTEKVNKAQAHYNGLLVEHANASRKAFGASELLAGITGGALVLGLQGVAKGFESIAELGAESFEGAIEGAEKFADQILDIGDKYENLEIQVTEFSGLSGAALDAMNSHVKSVFSSLDVTGDDTGKVMSQLAMRLGTGPSAALDELTKHVLELQGRFGDLRAEDVASMFTAFNVPIGQTDAVLGSLLQTAQRTGVSLGQLIGGLSGQTAEVLKAAGLNLPQGANVIAQMEKLGLSPEQVGTALQQANGEFQKEGLSFSQGMQLLSQRMANATPTEKSELAETFFGSRRWAVAQAAVDAYFNTVRAGADAFDAPQGSIDNFLDSTETLSNKVEELKHHIENTFSDVGLNAIHMSENGLSRVEQWFDKNQDRIKSDIASWGDTFIRNIPEVAAFLKFTIDAIAQIGNATKGFVAGIGEVGGALESVWGNLTHNPKLAKQGQQLFDAMTNLDHFDFNAMAQKADAWIDQVVTPSNLNSLGNGWDALWGQPPANDGGTPPAPTPPSPSGNAAIGTGGAVSGSAGGNAGLGQAGGRPGGSSAIDNKAIAQELFTEYFPMSEWPAFDKLEMSEAGYNANAKNPNSTAFGMGQFLDSTWKQYGYGPTGTTDPATQLELMFQYIKSRYGTPTAAWEFHKAHNWYSTGGPVGTDTIPAWLTPGEFVWNTEAVKKYGWLISMLNGHALHFDSGGFAPGATDNATTASPQFGGMPGMPSGAGEDIVDWLKTVVTQFNSAYGTQLTVTADYPGGPLGHPKDAGDHGVYRAIDISAPGNSQAQMDAFANWWVHNPQMLAATRQLIHNDPTGVFSSGMNVIGGHFTEGSQTYANAPWGGHIDHVHLAVQYIPGQGDAALPQVMDADWRVQRAQQRVDRIQKELDDAEHPTDRLVPDQDRIAQLQDELLDALHERTEAEQRAAKTTKKFASGEDSAEKAFGSSFLSGIADSLGLHELGLKPPWEFGSVKLGLGILNWAAGTAKAVQRNQAGAGFTDAGAPGGDGLGPYGPLMGVNLPAMAGVGAGPAPANPFGGVPRNIIPGLGGNAVGPAPGPTAHLTNYYTYDNRSIHVHNGGGPADTATIRAVQHVQNSAQWNQARVAAPGAIPA